MKHLNVESNTMYSMYIESISKIFNQKQYLTVITAAWGGNSGAWVCVCVCEYVCVCWVYVYALFDVCMWVGVLVCVVSLSASVFWEFMIPLCEFGWVRIFVVRQYVVKCVF